MDLSYVIPPVEKELIRKELTKDLFFRKTSYANRDIYITNAHQSPNIMQEIGRLRELSFGQEGGGSGTPCDIDEYDILPYPHCYSQLFVWDRENEEIVGGYRFILGENIAVKPDGELLSATADLFHFTDYFRQNFLPNTLELGRSFVSPDYQPSLNLKKGMYSLDNLWDGLGRFSKVDERIKYFFGKITMYPDLDRIARDYILYFYKKHFPDNEGMVYPKKEIFIITDFNELNNIFTGRSYKEDYQILLKKVRERNSLVPPLVNAYMNLSPTMRSFGTSLNEHFSNVEETGILVTIKDIYPEKQKRYFEY